MASNIPFTEEERESLQKAARRMEERSACFAIYQNLVIYEIQAWETVVLIPGGTELLRCYFVFDEEGRRAFRRDYKGKISLVDNPRKIRPLLTAVRHKVRSLGRGIFIRHLRVLRETSLFDLLLLLNGRSDLVMNEFPPELESQQQASRRKDEYLKNIFNTVVSRK